MDILSIGGEPVFDERITKFEIHTYNPYANTTLGYSDEIRIPIQQQDLYTLPSESFLFIEGKVVLKDKTKSVNLANNCIAFLFEELRYELDGVEIDRNRNVGITSTMKNFTSLAADRSRILKNAGWDVDGNVTKEEFNYCVPLNTLLGFCEDYKRIVINARHELILIRSRNDNNALIGGPELEPRIELLKVQWKMPHVTLNEINKLSLLKMLDSGRFLSMAFRSWDLYEYPLLQNTTKHSWSVKAATQLEKPRYVIFGLQTDRKNKLTNDASSFDHCKLSNVKLYLNSDYYPYDDFNLNFEKKKYAILYDMYVKFRKSYYGTNEEVFVNMKSFIEKCPLVVIDCSRQNESIKSGTIDVRIDFDFLDNVPNNTSAYCLIIHDRVIEYSPLTNLVRRIL